MQQASADFEALGFVLKPGRPHANGLQNLHAKFPDGSEIELITAAGADDALSSEYYHWLQSGDGPAFLALYAPDFDALLARLAELGLSPRQEGGLVALAAQAPALRRMFFAHRQGSPTDRPGYFAHANTAFGLAGAWIAGGADAEAVLQALGAKAVDARRCGPQGHSFRVLALPEGEIVLLAAAAPWPDRPIRAATVLVESLEAAQGVFAARHVSYSRAGECDSRSVWVAPTQAHGMWLQSREPAARRP